MKAITIFSALCLISIFQKCKGSKEYIIVNQIILKNEKVTITKNQNGELRLMNFIGNHHFGISMKRKLEKKGNYQLDSVKTIGNHTVVELFLRQEGVNSSIGFLYSYDSNRNFKYIDITEIDSTGAEGIEKIQINPNSNSINISLYNLTPKRHFISSDSCRSWQFTSK